MTIELIIIVAGLAVVQSVFGVGLLVFGTPILLLMGYDLAGLLWILLPASLAVSVSQLVTDKQINRLFLRSFLVWTLPGLALGLWLVLTRGLHLNLGLLVASTLILAVIFRHSARAAVVLKKIAAKYSAAALIVIGLIHGLSNMGGSLLSAYVAAVYTEKRAIRQAIALGYAIFAIVQLTWLGAVGHPQNYWLPILSATLGAGIYLTIGRAAFGAVTNQRFTVLFSICMLTSALALIWRFYIS